MNDSTSQLQWTEAGDLVLPMLPAYDGDSGAARRAALESDDTAWTMLAAMSWVLDGMGRMRNRMGPEIPDAVYRAAEDLIQAATAMQEELALSTMVSLGEVAEAKGIHRATAQSRRNALRASETDDEKTEIDREPRYRIGHRPRTEDARTWYRDSYANENEIREAREDAWIAERNRRQNRSNPDHGGVWTVNPETGRVDEGSTNVLRSNTVTNINTGTVGIQSADNVNGRDVEL